MNSAFLSNEATIALFQLFYQLLPYVPYEPQVTNRFYQDYDYIVAGGGTAGAVVAARLSEDPGVRVLLLEAGEGVNSITEIPAVATLAQGTRNDWRFQTQKQMGKITNVQNDQMQAQGKGIGGTSLINYFLYTRGNKRDFDLWAEKGAKGWSWDDVFPYFLKFENNTDPEIRNNGYHGKGGPLTVSTPPHHTKVSEAFIEAGREMGYKYHDTNGASQTGFSIIQGTIRDGRRCSTAKAYLIPAQDRPNLQIVNGAYVQKILINKNKVAYGVRFSKDGLVYDINANKEVIVSLGVFQTPKILMLSGIGPKDHLKSYGIKVIADLPVGNGLQNHLSSTIVKFTAPSSEPIVSEAELVKSFQTYRNNGSGHFVSPAGLEGLAYTNSKNNNPAMDWPDIELSVQKGVPKIINPESDIPEEDYESDEDEKNIIFFPLVMRTKDRGLVRLQSTNPYAYPTINFNLLSNQDDYDRLVDALTQCVKTARTKAFQKIGAQLSTKKLKGCENYEIYSQDYLKCAAKKYTRAAHHPSSTCIMGDPNDNSTVVDPQLKVKGIKNLRIVDGSVMPVLVSGYPGGATVMIAEKASDMIKMDNPDLDYYSY